MWECSKCGQKSEKKLNSSNGCEHQWWDEHDIAKAKEKQAKEEKINRAVFAFNDELLNTEDGKKRLKGESGWSWLKGSKGEGKIKVENIDIDKDIAECWLNSSFGKEWLASEYGKQYARYLNDTEIWSKDKISNNKKTESSGTVNIEKYEEEMEAIKDKIIETLLKTELDKIDEVKIYISKTIRDTKIDDAEISEDEMEEIRRELDEFLSIAYDSTKNKMLSAAETEQKQRAAAEQKRLAEEKQRKQAAEQKRLAEEKQKKQTAAAAAAEQKRLAEAKRKEAEEQKKQDAEYKEYERSEKKKEQIGLLGSVCVVLSFVAGCIGLVLGSVFLLGIFILGFVIGFFLLILAHIDEYVNRSGDDD